MKYILYCRKSSEEEARQVQSLDTQERLMMDFATINNMEVVKTFRESKSAKVDGNRPMFLKMVEMVKSGEADGILTIHTDRLARNLIDAGQVIKLIDQGQLKEVRTLTTSYNNATSLLYMGFDFLFASQYSRDLSVKVKAGNESKILKGEYPSNSPLGYKNIQGGIIPDPQKAIFIKKAFDLYSTGDYSVKSLTKELVKTGFTTKKGHKVCKTVVHRILSNSEYLGLIVRKGVTYSGNHEPLVSKSLFNSVQQRLSNKHNTRRKKLSFLYRDFLTCSACGCKITADFAKHTYIYYHCTNGKNFCDQHKSYLSEKTVEELFAEYFEAHAVDEELATLSLEVYKDSLRNENKLEFEQGNAIKNELVQIDIKLQKLLDLRIDGEIDKEMFSEKKQKLVESKKELETNLNSDSQTDLTKTFELLDKVKVRACNVQEMFKNGDKEIKLDLLKSFVSNCYLEDKKITELNLNLPYAPILGLDKNSKMEEWRRRWDSNPRVPKHTCFPSKRHRPLGDSSFSPYFTLMPPQPIAARSHYRGVPYFQAQLRFD